MTANGCGQPILSVSFYLTEAGSEPVRQWLLGLSSENRKSIGIDIRKAQYGWPLGMPVVRKLEPDLWEIRSRIRGGIARVLFTVDGSTMILLHGFVKKSQRTSAVDLETGRRRLKKLREE